MNRITKETQFYDALQRRDYEYVKKNIPEINKDYISFIFNLHLSTKSFWMQKDIVDIVKMFLENGANPNLGSELYHQRTVLHFAVEVSIQQSNLHNIEQAIIVLLDYGANPNQPCFTYDRATPWHGIYSNNVILIKKFLEKGADVNYHIIKYDCFRTDCREKLVIYRLSKLYKQMIESKKRAVYKIKELVYKQLFYRTGGMITSF